jgi:hypothetical protein
MTKDELTEPLGCVVVRPLLANRATPPGGCQSEDCLTAAQEDIQRLSALVRAQQITIDKLEQARSAPVQEPVAFNAGVPPLYPEMKDGETISVEYTTSPAQRQWVGLTDDEFENIELGCRSTPFGKIEAMRKVEAKLKEKNGWYRQHVTDGSPCWCEPETSYTDPETGASVVVHKEPQ